MKVTVCSREEIEAMMTADDFPQNTAVISFCDPELKHAASDYTRVDFSGACDNVFYCEVDDLDLDSLPEKGYTYESFFPEVKELAAFIIKAYLIRSCITKCLMRWNQHHFSLRSISNKYMIIPAQSILSTEMQSSKA